MFVAIKDWLVKNQSGLIVGAVAGGVVAWVFRASIAHLFGV